MLLDGPDTKKTLREEGRAHNDGRRYAPLRISTRRSLPYIGGRVCHPRASSQDGTSASERTGCPPEAAAAPRCPMAGAGRSHMSAPIGEYGAMAGPSPELAAALDAIVAQLRRVLRELEEDDIPVPLRKVAKSTGKRLPPPLLRSLLVEVDRNEWFREKAREEIDAEAHPDAAAFLSRDPGWWIDLADQAVASAGVSSRAEEAQRIALARNEEALGEAKRRARELRAENATLTAEVKTLKAALRSAPPGAKASARRDGLAAQLRAAEAQLERERRQRLEADARVSELLRRRTERHRRSEAAAAALGRSRRPCRRGAAARSRGGGTCCGCPGRATSTARRR